MSDSDGIELIANGQKSSSSSLQQRGSAENARLIAGSGSNGGVANSDANLHIAGNGTSPVVTEFVGDRQRFIVAAAFCLVNGCSGIQWITFGPIVDEVREYFDVTAAQVNLLASIYMFFYTVAVYFTCVTFKHVGLRKGLVMGAILNMACSVCKIVAALVWPDFILLVLSQVFGAACQQLTISIPPLVASEWFLAEERTLVTIICANSLNVGIAIGSVLPPLIVTPENKGRAAFTLFFCIQGAVALVGLLMTTLCVPPKPKTPPSFAAMSKSEGEGVEDGADDVPIGTSVLSLLKNPSFALIMVITAVTVGLQWTIASVLPQVLRPFGVTEASVGWMGFLSMATGTLVAAVGGIAVAKNKKYKSSMIAALFIFVLVLGSWIAYLAQADPDSNKATAISYPLYIIIGWCVGFLLPVGMEFGVELTFPIHESISSTALSWAASAFSVATVGIFTAMLGNNPSKEDALNVLVSCLVSVLIGALCMVGVVPNLHRDNFESASASAAGSPTEVPSSSPVKYTAASD